MKRYRHISLEEREKLYALREQGLSLREIARKLERSQSSLTRELKRNIRYGNEYRGNIYLPCKAEILAQRRARKQRAKAPLKNPMIFLYVREHLRTGWSPEAIAGRLPIDHPGQSICHETIYQYIYAKKTKTRGMHLEQYLTVKRKRRMKKNGRSVQRLGTISEAISIEKRSLVVARRKQIGHWETDLIIGQTHDQSALSVTVERVSRVTVLSKLINRTAADKTHMLTVRMQQFPDFCRKTLTTDNGAENTYHQQITKETGLKVYFCHAYHSWEKGTVENTNGRIRRFLSKGVSIDGVSNEYIADLEYRLNTTPRKCLNYLTPYEKMTKLLASTTR